MRCRASACCGYRAELTRINHYVVAAGLRPLPVEVDAAGRRDLRTQTTGAAVPKG